MNNYILDDSGNPVPELDLLKWARWLESHDHVVAKTELGEVMVSTVFLAVDHGFGSTHRPVLWETMVFGGELDGVQKRYTSRAAALAGHAETVAQVLASR
jgi:hypothetical protein